MTNGNETRVQMYTLLGNGVLEMLAKEHMKHDAVLFNARVEGDRVSGNCYCDVKGRFYDGEWVTTSTVLEQNLTYIRTRNSVYKVVWAA